MRWLDWRCLHHSACCRSPIAVPQVKEQLLQPYLLAAASSRAFTAASFSEGNSSVAMPTAVSKSACGMAGALAAAATALCLSMSRLPKKSVSPGCFFGCGAV
jgi:hypothetical protein